ncbi:hypothetical protein LXL04_029973 [Taraxacum kok-saghyz]
MFRATSQPQKRCTKCSGARPHTGHMIESISHPRPENRARNLAIASKPRYPPTHPKLEAPRPFCHPPDDVAIATPIGYRPIYQPHYIGDQSLAQKDVETARIDGLPLSNNPPKSK